MKRYRCTITILTVLALGFSACSSSIVPERTEVPAEVYSVEPSFEAVPTEVPAVMQAEEPTAVETSDSVSVTVETDTRYFYSSEFFPDNDDSRLLVSYSAAHPALSIPGNPLAADTINAMLREDWEILTETDLEGSYTLMPMLSLAKEEYARAVQAESLEYTALPYALQRTVDAMRVDSSVISLTYETYTNAGGAHGYISLSGRTFSAKDGRALAIEDLSEDPGFSDFCSEYAVALSQTSTYTNQYVYWDDYEMTIRDIVGGEGWYLSDVGLEIIANPYDISAYAAGRILFTIPYSELEPYLLPDFIPPAATASSGEIFIREATENEQPTYLTDDDTQGEGMRVLLTAEGDITDISLHRVQAVAPEEYTADSTVEYVRCGLLWCADILKDGESLEVLTWIPDVLPNLEISYRTASGEMIFRNIFQSGMDGSLLLL